MRIIVTGAAGLVGQNLVPRLVEAGHAVVGFDKNATNLQILEELNPRATCHAQDLSTAGSWQEEFAGAGAVVDLKAQITALGPDTFQRHNVDAGRQVLEACRRHGVPHLIHLSSSVVISVADDSYTRSKKEAEELVLASGLPFTVLRPPLLYGCFDAKHLGYIFGLLKKSPIVPIPGSGRYMRQPLYVKDLCGIILKCLERGPSRAVHNVIGHERLDFIDMLRQIARENRLHRLLLPVPLPLFRAALAVHGALWRKPAFTTEQLAALIAGDDFPVEPWSEQFGVRYTPFAEALGEIYASPLSRFNREMASPH